MSAPYYADDLLTLYHGDCRELIPALALAGVDVTMADPPYGQTSLAWDRWPQGWLSVVAGVSRSLWCFGSLRLFMERADEFAPWKFSHDIVWEKHNGSSFHADRFKRVHEQAAHFYQGAWESVYKAPPTTNDATARTVRRKQRPPHMGHIEAGTTYRSVDGGPRLMRSVIYVRSTHGHARNETQKPQGIVAPLVEFACPPRGCMLVPFAGSGTDLLIAKLTGRRAVGFELREQQCEIAATALRAVLPLEVSA